MQGMCDRCRIARCRKSVNLGRGQASGYRRSQDSALSDADTRGEVLHRPPQPVTWISVISMLSDVMHHPSDNHDDLATAAVIAFCLILLLVLKFIHSLP
jgi:hypothetical protein